MAEPAIDSSPSILQTSFAFAVDSAQLQDERTISEVAVEKAAEVEVSTTNFRAACGKDYLVYW